MNDWLFLSLSEGFMTREERKKFESLHSPYNKYWIPCVWFANLAAVARCEGRIKDNNTYKLLMEVSVPAVSSHVTVRHIALAVFRFRDIKARMC